MKRRDIRAAMLGLVFVVLPLSAVAGAPTPQQRARTILNEGAYGFCTDSQRWVRPSEMRYCDYVDRNSACPAFVLACESTLHPKRSSCNAPDRIGSATNAVRWVVVLAVLSLAAALLFLVLRSTIRATRAESATDRRVVTEERESRIPLPVATSSELFARALEAHERGEHRSALFTLYAALLRKLDESGVIRIDPSFTNGDYVRQCRSSDAKGPLREVSREVERVRFGGASASSDAFVRLRGRIEPIVRSLAVLAMAVWVASAPGCGRERTSDVSETSAAGDRAVRELLTAVGIRARPLASAPEEVHDTSRVLVMNLSQVHLEPDQWRAVLVWVDRGGSLILAGGTTEWPQELGVRAQADLRGSGSADVELDASLGGLRARIIEGGPELNPGPNGHVLGTYDDGNPFAVQVDRQQGHVLALAGSELVTNAGIAVGSNADVLVALVRSFAHDRDVYFVEDAEGAAGNPITAMARAGILPLVLQGLLALVLFYVMVGRHFGTPRDRVSQSRRSFAEHVRAVGYLYARARSSRAALRAYSRLVMERIRDRVGAHGTSLPEAIAARVGEPREDVEAVCRAVEQIQGTEGSFGIEADDLRLIKRLNDWFTRLV